MTSVLMLETVFIFQTWTSNVLMPITTVVLSTKYKEGSSSAMQINVRFFMLVTLSIEKKGDTNAWFCCILDRRYCCAQKGNVISNHLFTKSTGQNLSMFKSSILEARVESKSKQSRDYILGLDILGFSSKILFFKKSSSPPSLTLSFSHLIILSFPASWFLN